MRSIWPRVYISGPITKGNRTENFAQACLVQEELLRTGFATMNPMLSMMHPNAWNIDHKAWLSNDLPWVAVSDVVYRLPGESVGADEECEYAESFGIPVIDNLVDLLEWREQWLTLQMETANEI